MSLQDWGATLRNACDEQSNNSSFSVFFLWVLFNFKFFFFNFPNLIFSVFLFRILILLINFLLFFQINQTYIFLYVWLILQFWLFFSEKLFFAGFFQKTSQNSRIFRQKNSQETIKYSNALSITSFLVGGCWWSIERTSYSAIAWGK